jgi:hypothetical protein
LATISAADLKTSLGDLGLSLWSTFTIGEPRSANKAFAETFAELGIVATRLVDKKDIVPHLPTEDLSFVHVSSEYWISDDEGATFFCKYDVGKENNDCSNRLSNFPYSIKDHLQAYGAIGTAACK